MTDMRCTNIPSHQHPPCEVTYLSDNPGAYRYHCLKLPCGSDKCAGEKRTWITTSVGMAESEGLTRFERCFTEQ